MTKLYEYKTITDDVEIEHELWKEYGDLFKEILEYRSEEYFAKIMEFLVRSKKTKKQHLLAMDEVRKLMGNE